jgi:integrase
MTTTEKSWEHLLAALGVKPDKRGRLPERLTEELAERARTRPLGFAYRLRDGEVPGLALHVGAEAATSWWLAYRAQGGRREMSRLGAGDTFDVASARKTASELLVRVRKGENPAASKRERRATEKAADDRVTLRRFVESEKGNEGEYWRKKLALRKEGRDDRLRLLNVWASLLDKPLGEISRDDIETVLADRRADSNVLALAFKWKLIGALPIAGLPEPLVGFKPEPRLRYVGQRGDDERERLLAALAEREAVMDADDDARMLVFAARLAWATGMRRTEILGLRESEVGADAIVIPAHRTKKARERRVRLNDAAREALKIWKVRSAKGEFFPGHQDDRGWPGEAFSKWCGRLDRAWQALLADAGIQGRGPDGGRSDLHLHDLRHSFATSLRKQGVALEIVRDALGHADLHSTQIYAHVGEDEVADAVAKVKL